MDWGVINTMNSILNIYMAYNGINHMVSKKTNYFSVIVIGLYFISSVTVNHTKYSKISLSTF